MWLPKAFELIGSAEGGDFWKPFCQLAPTWNPIPAEAGTMKGRLASLLR